MKNLLTALILLLSTAAFGAKYFTDIIVEDGKVQMKERAAAPASVSTYGFIYPKTDKKLYFTDSNGTEFNMLLAGAASMDDITNVDTSGVATGDVFVYDGTNWVDSDVLKATDGAVVVGSGNASPSSIFSVFSTDKGSQPCVAHTTLSRDAIVSPDMGLCVYNTTALEYQQWDGTQWKGMGGGAGGISNWISGIAYVVDDVVIYANKIFQAITAHTSSIFDTDYNVSGFWKELANAVNGPSTATINSIAIWKDATGDEIQGTPINIDPTLGDIYNVNNIDAASMSLNNVGEGNLRVDSSGNIATGDILGQEITGLVPTENGGTNADLLAVASKSLIYKDTPTTFGAIPNWNIQDDGGLNAVISITPANPASPAGVNLWNYQHNITPSEDAPNLSETFVNYRSDYGGGNDLSSLNIANFSGNTGGAGTLGQMNYVYAGGGLGDGTNGGTTNYAAMYGGNMGLNAGHTVGQFKGVDLNMYSASTSLITDATGHGININMDGPISSSFIIYNAGANFGIDATMNSFTGMNFNPNFGGHVTGAISGINFNPNLTASANNINILYSNPNVSATTDSMVGVDILGNGSATIKNYTGVEVSPNFTSPSEYLTGYRLSFQSDASLDAKGVDVQMSGDAPNIYGHNVNITGNASSAAVGLNINMQNGIVAGGRNQSISANGESVSINSGATLLNNGNFDALGTYVAQATVQAGSPVSTDFLGMSSPIVLVAHDNMTPGVLGFGASSVGYVGQLLIDAGVNVQELSMAVGASVDGGSGVGSTITDYSVFRSKGLLNFGGNLQPTNSYHFKADAGGLGTNMWGIWVGDSNAENYFAKSASIGVDRVSSTNTALEVGSKKTIRLGRVTTAEKVALITDDASIVYDTDASAPSFYNGVSWTNWGSGGGGGDASTSQLLVGMTANRNVYTDATGTLVVAGAANDGQFQIGSTGSNPVIGQIVGTASQTQIVNGPGTIQVKTAQDIGSDSTVTFGTIKGANLTDTRVALVGASGLITDDADFTYNTDTLIGTKGNFGNTLISNDSASSSIIAAQTTSDNLEIKAGSISGSVKFSESGVLPKKVGSRNPELLELLKYPSFEEGVAEGTCTNCTSTHSTTTGSMFGTKHLDMVFGASSTGDYTVDKTTGFDSAMPAIASCYIKTTRAGVRLYGRTGGADTSAYIDVSDAGTWAKYEVPFSCGTTSCGYKVNASTATTTTISVNECHVTIGQKTLNVGAISGWKDYGSASSFTGVGTPTVTKLQWRQVGENIEVQAKFTTGTVTAVEFKLNLPDGYTVDSSKIGTNIVTGLMQRNSQNGIDYSVVATGGDSYVGVARGTASGSAFTRITANVDWNSTEVSQMTFSVPVTQLRSTVTLSGMLGPSQARFYNITNCLASTTSATFADMVDTDCTYSATAKIGTTVTPTTTGALALKIPTVKAGKYNVSVDGAMITSGTAICSYRLYDGTNIVGPSYTDVAASAIGAAPSLSSVIEYTSDQANLEWKLQAERVSGSGTCYAQADNDTKSISISLTPISEFAAGGGEHPIIYLSDVKASGTDGGSSSAGTTYNRNLNTLSDPLSGGFVSNSSSFTGTGGTNTDFTLIAGTYRVRAEAPTCKPNGTRIRLYNTTDSTNDIFGQSIYTNQATGCLMAPLDGIITISSSKTFQIKHYIGATEAGDGLGGSSADGSPEVYTKVSIEKIR